MEQKSTYLDDEILRFVFVAAMRDSVIQKAYVGNKKWTENENVYKCLKNIIEPMILKVLQNKYKSQKEYDNELLKVLKQICEFMNSQKECTKFTFGNAQKLVNMMFKYFYITCYIDDTRKEFFRYCHCPLDSQMLQKIWTKCRKLDKNKTNGKREWFMKSWGNEEFIYDKDMRVQYPERYLAFQQAVGYFSKEKHISSLEFDFDEWNK